MMMVFLFVDLPSAELLLLSELVSSNIIVLVKASNLQNKLNFSFNLCVI